MNRRGGFAFGFLALIAVGAVLLASPFARTEGVWGNFFDAAFIACSAVCVTGLTVVDIGREYTTAGLSVLMALVQLGCLGLMTIGTFLMVAIGRRISLSSEFTLMNAYGITGIRGLKSLIVWVVASMLLIEAAGAAALYPVYHDWFTGIFFSVMGFCNAGFSLFGVESLPIARGWYGSLTMGTLTVAGGIGFLVIYNLCTFPFLRRRSGGKGRLTLHTKIVLEMTAALLAVTFLFFLALEWDGALAVCSDASSKLATAFYQAVTPRTCGFTAVATESLRPITRLVYEILMFIGGAPGSAAAGIKVTTFAVLLCTLTALCRGEQETIVGRRVVPYDIVRESIVIFTALIALAAIVTGSLLLTEEGRGIANDAIFFEAVSAITTTGLSVGETTAKLSGAGRIVIMVAMFLGRLGALTVVMMIGDRENKRHVRYPSEEIVVG